MKLLISPTNEEEAAEAIAGGADIIDVKNPKEGALGASFPWIIKRIKAITPLTTELSCTLGDASNHPGTTALAALGAATTGVDYIKTGLQGVKTKEDAVSVMRKISQAIRDYDSRIRVVVVGYADAHRADSVSPLAIPEIAAEAKLDVAMIDTAVKDGSSILDWLTSTQLSSFVETSHNYDLTAALAGALQKEHLHMVYALNADIVGMRGAACTDKDRVNGRLRKESVREIADILRKLEAKHAKSNPIGHEPIVVNKNI
jgi:uncharacterized protein (UPF0264 family)